MNFIIRWLVTAVAVGVAVWLVPGIDLIGGTGDRMEFLTLLERRRRTTAAVWRWTKPYAAATSRCCLPGAWRPGHGPC